MMMGGLGDGMRRASSRCTGQLSGFSRLTSRRCFGRKQWREHSRNYLQGLLVQVQGAAQRREPVGIGSGHPARAMQRFLTEAPVGR